MAEIKIKKRKMKGGKISSSNLQKMIKASYDVNFNEDIDGYKKDNSLSNSEITCFYDPSINHAVAVFRGTERTFTDWSNNAMYIAGQYEKTDRFKRAKKMYEKIANKYGEKNVSLVGHSQSGAITRLIGENAKEIINLNPANLGEKNKDNEHVVRSSNDLVSAIKPVSDVIHKVKDETTNALKKTANYFLPKNKQLKLAKDTSKQNITIEDKTFNPAVEHSEQILERLPDDTMIGQGRRRFSVLYNL